MPFEPRTIKAMYFVPNVYFVVGGSGELEPAAFAGVRLLLAVMHSTVSDELTFLSKALLTVTAGERLLP